MRGDAEGTKWIGDLGGRRDKGTMEIDVKAPVEGSIGERLILWVIQDPRNTELMGEHPFKIF